MRSSKLSAVLAAGALAASVHAPAQSGEEIRAVSLHSTRRSVSVSAENQWAAEASSSRSGEYRETVELGFSGSIYHPNLVSYLLDTQLGLWQLEDAGLAAPGFTPGFVANVHLITTWLQEKPYSFSLFADHGEQASGEDLFQQARIRETVLGATGQWINPLAPLSFSLRQSWRDEDRERWQSTEESLHLAAGLIRSSADERIRTRLDYAFTDFDRQVVGLFAQQGYSHDLRASNDLAFGTRGQNHLSSSACYLDLQGSFDSRTLDLTELLELTHPFGLASRYSYGLHVTAAGSGQAVTHLGHIRISHQLYDSLTSTLTGRGSLTTAQEYDQWSAGPSLELAYRKKVLTGHLNLSYGTSADWQSRDAAGFTVMILDERHLLNDGQIVLLDNPLADSQSVVLRDAAGTVVYVAGVDFALVAFGDSTQLLRLPGGAIPNGSEVRVDYLAAGAESLESLRLAQSAGVRFEYFQDALAVYYRYHRERYPYLSGSSGRGPEMIDQHVAGASLDLAPVLVSAEYEHRGSSLLGYDALRFQQSLLLPIGQRSLLTLEGAQNLVRPAEDGRLQAQLEIQSRYAAPIGGFAVLSLSGGYRSQGRRQLSLPSLWTARAGLELDRGKLTASAVYDFRAAILEARAPHLNHTLRVNLRREL